MTVGTRRLVLTVLMTAGIGAALAAGFRIVGSPAEARVRRFDARRVADLRAIRGAVQGYASRHHRLPAALDDLGADQGSAAAPRDPASGQPYGYRVKDARHYELCAEFSRISPGTPGRWTPDFSVHEAGRQCYDLEVPAESIR